MATWPIVTFVGETIMIRYNALIYDVLSKHLGEVSAVWNHDKIASRQDGAAMVEDQKDQTIGIVAMGDTAKVGLVNDKIDERKSLVTIVAVWVISAESVHFFDGCLQAEPTHYPFHQPLRWSGRRCLNTPNRETRTPHAWRRTGAWGGTVKSRAGGKGGWWRVAT